MGAVMDHAPRKIFSLIRAGFRDEVLEPLELGGFAIVLVSAFLVSRAVRTRRN
mgnify:CR=1 FL=1